MNLEQRQQEIRATHKSIATLQARTRNQLEANRDNLNETKKLVAVLKGYSSPK